MLDLHLQYDPNISLRNHIGTGLPDHDMASNMLKSGLLPDNLVEITTRSVNFRDAAITPPKIQGCRMCRQSGKLDTMCHPPTCWNGNVNDKGVYSCPDHPDAIQNNKYSRWHQMPCEHGLDTNHTVPKGQECYSCNGLGKRDYGSKRVSLLWDGSPLKVKNQKIVMQNQTDLERIVASYAGPTSTV